MTDQIDVRVHDLSVSLVESGEQASQLQTVLDRTIQVLNKRGVQIMIDFDEMIGTLRHNLESAQRSSNFVSDQLSQLQELVHTSRLLTSSLELNKVLEGVIDTVIKLTGAERAYLMLKQPNSDELKVQAARNWEHETLNQEEVTFSQGIIRTAIDAKLPIVTTNAQDDERFQGMRSVFSHDLRSVIIVPLTLKDEIVGVLYADNRIEQAVFSQDNVPLLTAFANQAAIAISNARLFEKVKGDLKEAKDQVRRLQIEIDQGRLREKVTEITESDFFDQLSLKAKELRERRQQLSDGTAE